MSKPHTVESLFDALWVDYQNQCPSATAIHALLSGGEAIVNDHVAFRTFNLPEVGLDKLAAHFLALGYEPKGEYRFEQKKLAARHFEHPNPTAPKVFISELQVQECSPELQDIVKAMVAQVPAGATETPDFLYSGAPWKVSKAQYDALLKESEYAAWLAAFGYRANHFTVDVNALNGFETLESVNQALKDAGFELNSSGGEIKGSAEVLLEQSSTLADKVAVTFTDERVVIPSCFYEFALRYPKADGHLYTGFVAASADKIFESTDAR
ncbi:DUF1338 domain-containing protein [Ferrimonas balearica]|uniref:DUF1338 domain-containing protein n=1 Tax=Ferrimonas balearica TaxID=44012 RepID=UPI001C993F04|nr:DUF1338 domain-containing protein [Ferrimonas balearica]MBY5922434.1 DUF1338 domain-containing protein [Ferrimonas balearica]MBY5995418.1 DUF1338 domain-containing protein [Ferrimonas balearica]